MAASTAAHTAASTLWKLSVFWPTRLFSTFRTMSLAAS